VQIFHCIALHMRFPVIDQ